ncbi:TPA: hemerythrin domain-containing protein [Campylobacter lari]|uniref:bacteriohemerythrin n=3 Tax=Campylobacter lari TaxID=201 RepID=UPI0008747509|nr:hemerythrin domain-containing protein [Campylobacter lari]EAH4936388.1 hemerythrin family non-heme iron protein [Campylobacter lari]EAH7838323.1 hemerythrin family non-heme iron protein [Campylobacter lari]EAI0282712.1 hemerythrin family non-heme iron protein [Campylobacter lari]EAI0925206.1 hemerythrin family non-heme iron protein [Campylobacter lari]EAI2016699.1 hemerythrin family non-heme iron protein [Campylobacter lari]
MLPEWDQKYNINNVKIDNQHKKLFKLAAKVEEISDRPIYQVELKKLIAEFFHYIKIHFQDEESYMAEINYPYISQHKLMHKQITKSMIQLIQSIKSTNDLKEKLYIVVNSWLLEHIIQHDMMIEHWKRSTQEQNITNLNQEEKPKIKKFLYQCQCEEKTHKVPYDIHLKIQYSKAQFKCKECSTNLILQKEKIEN